MAPAGQLPVPIAKEEDLSEPDKDFTSPRKAGWLMKRQRFKRGDRSEGSKKWAVIPEHEAKHGHPIIAGRELMEAFLRAPVISNARDVEHAHQSKLVYVHVADANVIRNVDTPDQYQDLTRG